MSIPDCCPLTPKTTDSKEKAWSDVVSVQETAISPIFNKSWLKTQGLVYINGHTKGQPAPGWDLKHRSKAFEEELEQVKASGQASSTRTLFATVLTESKLMRGMEKVNPWTPVGEVLAAVVFIRTQVLL